MKEWSKDNPTIRWRQLIYRTLNHPKQNTTMELLGYSPQQLKEHLDKQGMDWNIDNIDHKIPVSWFKLDTPPSVVNDLYNLQPLNENENKSKSNNYCHPVDKLYYDLVIEYILEEKIEFLRFF
jgi:hypothetical protein